MPTTSLGAGDKVAAPSLGITRQLIATVGRRSPSAGYGVAEQCQVTPGVGLNVATASY